MTKRRESGLDVIAALPWPAGVAIGIAFFIGVRVIGVFFAASANPFLKPFGEQIAHGGLSFLPWIALILCWIAAAVSFFRGHDRKQLLKTQTGLDSLSKMNWREFEMLVGEAFRRQGYAVEETGLGGADGGIDLVLRKDGRTELVQCKQWRTRQIKVNVVREMAGLLAHHRADAVKIVCVGEFTRDAEEFARGKAIDLINGERLLKLVLTAQTVAGLAPRTTLSTTNPGVEPPCPICGARMVKRIARDKQRPPFLGCSTFPACRGIRTYVD